MADRALHEVIQLCRQEGIAVTMFIMPEGAEFRRWYPPAVRAETDVYLERLQREHGVEVIDGRTWATDDDLLDGFHLLPEGAARFTERFGQELAQPALNRQARLQKEQTPE